MQYISTTIHNSTQIITLDRPDKMNAITLSMYDEMTRSLSLAEATDDISCAVFRGSGNAFTAGNDLKDFLQTLPSEGDGGAARFIEKIATFRKPLGAVVTGHAVGIGVTLLLHCDFVVASKSARFSAPFINLGLVPEAGSTYLAPLQLGQKAANRLFLLGETLDADEAIQAGLISHVREADALEYALGIADKIAKRHPRAIQETKKLLRLEVAEKTLKQIKVESEVFEELMQSDYCKAAFESFLKLS